MARTRHSRSRYRNRPRTSRRLRRWDAAEKRFLAANYGVIPTRDIAIRLDRSVGSCRHRANRLGIYIRPHGTYPIWTRKDIAYLKSKYGKESTHDIAKHLSRTVRATWAMAHELGLRTRHGWDRPYGKWKPEEDAYVKKSYLTIPIEVIAQTLKRTPTACRMRANELGLRRIRLWTERDFEFLRHHYNGRGAEYVARHLGVDVRYVHWRARKLGVRSKRYVPPWTGREIAYLKRHAQTMTYQAIALKLGRKHAAVMLYAQNVLGLRKMPPVEHWSARDVEYLQHHATKKTAEEIANILHRPKSSVQHKAHRLHLHLKRPLLHWQWKPEEIAFMKKHATKMTAEEMARTLGRTRAAVQGRSSVVGVRLRRPPRKDAWTPKEMTYVKRYAATRDATEIANALGRTVFAVQGFAFTRGIKLFSYRSFRKWEESEKRYAIKHFRTQTLREIGEALGRNTRSVAKFLNSRGYMKRAGNFRNQFS